MSRLSNVTYDVSRRVHGGSRGFTATRDRGGRLYGYAGSATALRARARRAAHTTQRRGVEPHPAPPAACAALPGSGTRTPETRTRPPCRAGPTHHSPARRGPWHAARGVSGPRSRPIRDCAIARALHCSAFCGGLPRRGRRRARLHVVATTACMRIWTRILR